MLLSEISSNSKKILNKTLTERIKITVNALYLLEKEEYINTYISAVFGSHSVMYAGVYSRRLCEATHAIPHTDDQFDLLKSLFASSIPAGLAKHVLYDLLDDDGLFDEIDSMAQQNQLWDVRPVILNWIQLHMPDQMHRLFDAYQNKPYHGLLSPIHGF